MKSKVAVVALCVCVILAVLGVVLGKSPALENTELPPSVSEKILSSQEISSESEASSAEVSTPAKTTTPKEEYESMYGKPQWLVCDQTYHILRAEDGTLTTETGKAPIYTRGDFKAEVMDVHVSDTLEYGLTQEDGSFTYSVDGDCTIDESGKITNPNYVLAYVTLRLNYEGTADYIEFLVGECDVVQYNLDGYPLGGGENASDKTILENGVAVSTTEEEDPRNSGHVWVRPGEPRDVLIVVLIQNKFSYVVVDDEAAAKDGVSNLNVMEQNYATGVYEEMAFKYAITISSSGTQMAAFNVTEIVNDWFKG